MEDLLLAFWEKLTFTSIVVAASCTLISNVSVVPLHINFERSKINSLMLFKSLGKQEQTTSKQYMGNDNKNQGWNEWNRNKNNKKNQWNEAYAF